MNVGFVVESARRAAALAYRLRHWTEHEQPGRARAPCWVTTADELTADPFGAIWRAPDGGRVSAREMASFEPAWELPRLGPLSDDGPEALDDRLLTAVGRLGRNIWR